MNTEDLKLLAGYVGLNIDESAKSSDGVVCDSGIPWHSFIYNPLQNNDQLVELIEKLFEYRKHIIVKGGDGIWVAQGLWKVQIYKDGFVSEGKTLAEAVVNAAIEMIKKCS